MFGIQVEECWKMNCIPWCMSSQLVSQLLNTIIMRRFSEYQCLLQLFKVRTFILKMNNFYFYASSFLINLQSLMEVTIIPSARNITDLKSCVPTLQIEPQHLHLPGLRRCLQSTQKHVLSLQALLHLHITLATKCWSASPDPNPLPFADKIICKN